MVSNSHRSCMHVGEIFDVWLCPSRHTPVMEGDHAQASPSSHGALDGEKYIVLNVGGVIHETSLQTLRKHPNTLLGSMFAVENMHMTHANSRGQYFIDRSGRYFEAVLEYYRTDRVTFPRHLDRDTLVVEYDFYGIPQEAVERGLREGHRGNKWEYSCLFVTGILVQRRVKDEISDEHVLRSSWQGTYSHVLPNSTTVTLLESHSQNMTSTNLLKCFNMVGEQGWEVWRTKEGAISGTEADMARTKIDVHFLKRRIC